MPIKIASVSGTWTKDVFTDKGLYIGKVEDFECDLKRYKLRAIVVKAVKGSYLSTMLGNKRGLIIPYPMVESIGDVVIVKHISAPVEDTQQAKAVATEAE